MEAIEFLKKLEKWELITLLEVLYILSRERNDEARYKIANEMDINQEHLDEVMNKVVEYMQCID